MAKIIKLQGSDGEEVVTNEKTVKCSTTITTMLEIGADDDDGTCIIPVKKVTSKILRKVLEWAKHHENDPEPFDDDEEEEEEDTRRNTDIAVWDSEFLQVDNETLYELISAGNYLGIKGLFDVACKKVVNMIKDKSQEEMRAILNVPNDFITQ